MTSQKDFLKDIFTALEQAGIAYMVSGSISSTFYGRPRSTQDIDIVIEATIEKLQELLSILQKKKYYVDEETALEALSYSALFNVFDSSSDYKADFIIRKDRPYSLEEFKRKKMVDVLGLSLYLVTPEDAILSKLEWAKRANRSVNSQMPWALRSFRPRSSTGNTCEPGPKN